MSDSCNCGKDLWKKPKETICFNDLTFSNKKEITKQNLYLYV